MKFSTTLATFLVALTLAACGGGGGGVGQSPAPQPTPTTPSAPRTADTTKPVLTLVTSSPASLTTTVVISSSKELSGNIAILMMNGNTQISGDLRLNAGNRGMTWTPRTALVCNTVYTGKATGTDLDGNVSDLLTFTVTTVGCGPASWWPPATIAPVGQIVTGMNVLPGTEVAIGDMAWQAAVRDGTVKFVDTGMIQTGADTRPVVWAIMRYGERAWCFAPVHRDDGSASLQRTNPGTQCNSEEIDYVVGTESGLLRHFPGRNQCFEVFWDLEGRNHDRVVACPQ